MFYVNTDHKSVWLPLNAKVSEGERVTVQSEKLMSTNVWRSNGFHVINVLSKAVKFNADHYITDVLISLAEWHKTQVSRADRKLIVHAENARPHTRTMSLNFLDHNGMKKHITRCIHLIEHRLISISSAMSSSS
jgi:hypothetical protein